jgi:hypothetical protein
MRRGLAGRAAGWLEARAACTGCQFEKGGASRLSWRCCTPPKPKTIHPAVPMIGETPAAVLRPARRSRPAAAEAPASLSRSRSRSGRSSHILANRSNLRRCRLLAGRPPTGASSCRCMMTAPSFNLRPKTFQRSTFTASESCRTRGINEAARWPAAERLRTAPRKTLLRG